MNSKKLARFMHEEYEKIAKRNNWKTQESTRVDFDNLPEENKKTMLEVAKKVNEEIIREFTEIAKIKDKKARDAGLTCICGKCILAHFNLKEIKEVLA